jgi:hypothetical protein
MSQESQSKELTSGERRGTRFFITAFVGALLVLLAASGVTDRLGEERVEDGFQRALVAFGVARALNGAISVAQGTEVAIEPAGVGVNLAPGQVLDPVNDLVEQFSWVMLASTTSFGLQRILLEIFAWPGFTLLLAVLVLVLAFALWSRDGWLARRRLWILRFALFVAFLRFIVPALAVVGETVHSVFIESRYSEALTGLEAAEGELGVLSAGEDSTPDAEKSGWFDWVPKSMDVNGRLEKYRNLATRTVERTVDLIIIFVFQTVVLPLAFLWFAGLAYRALVRLWRGGADTAGPGYFPNA